MLSNGHFEIEQVDHFGVNKLDWDQFEFIRWLRSSQWKSMTLITAGMWCELSNWNVSIGWNQLDFNWNEEIGMRQFDQMARAIPKATLLVENSNLRFPWKRHTVLINLIVSSWYRPANRVKHTCRSGLRWHVLCKDSQTERFRSSETRTFEVEK